MALKKSYSSRFGTNHTQAYHKISAIEWYGGLTINCRVGIYATEAARTAESQSIGEVQYSFLYTGSIDESFVSQSYEHLKTLDEYSGATDV